MVNWVLPVRGVQATLAVTTLGMMAYGKSPLHQLQHPRSRASDALLILSRRNGWNRSSRRRMVSLHRVCAICTAQTADIHLTVAQWWTSHWRQLSPSEVNWMIFSPVWTIIALVPLIVVPLKFDHLTTQPIVKFGMLFLEALTMLYWFGGFIALAVFLSDRICFGTVCSVAKAGTAIAAFEWVAFAVTAVFSVLRVFRGGRASGRMAEPKVEMHQGV